MVRVNALTAKRSRIIRSGVPRVLDLFAGCGGLSLGFQTAGFEVVGALEIDRAAARTYALNLHRDSTLFHVHAKPRDAHTSPEVVLQELEIDARRPDRAIDVLVGGPPCQAFARVGRPKLRAEARRRNRRVGNSAWLKDPRVDLFRCYLQYVDVLKPLAVVIENVPDTMNHGGQDIAGLICDELEARDYTAAYTLLNAANYGVPQIRERMFVIAWQRATGVDNVRFPEPTHHREMPVGYRGTRSCALRTILRDDMGDPWFYVEPPLAHCDLPRSPNTSEALRDLPGIDARKELKAGRLRRGVRWLDEAVDYPPRRRPHAYGWLMREWRRFATNGAVTGHEIRYLPRDYRIFARMEAGEEYPAAHARATKMFKARLASMKERPPAGSKAYQRLRDEFVPPYDLSKFANKWWKMDSRHPARTLMAHLGKDSYSHIHYADDQARTISVREAARLQSFPDGFLFDCAMNDGFRQIGNAVPPLLAYAIAQEIRSGLGLRRRPDIRKLAGLM